MERKTLSLKKPVDPEKIAKSLEIGLRFVDRKGRYILQKLDKKLVGYEYGMRAEVSLMGQVAQYELTWVDIPLCPETYGEAQA